MKTVFADTAYWIAIASPRDEWAVPAARARSILGDARIVTIDEILTEFLNSLASGGESVRRQAVKMVREILEASNVTVIRQSRGSFLGALELYERRTDKGYSLTDCTAMQAMYGERYLRSPYERRPLCPGIFEF